MNLSSEFFLGITENITLLAALAFGYSVIRPRLESMPDWLGNLLGGLFWGGTGMLSMTLPIEPAPGIIFDGRFIMIALAGVLDGIPAGLFAGTMIAAYRYSLGGMGMASGIGAIVTCTAISIVLGRLWKDSLIKKHINRRYLGLGLLLAVNMFAWITTLPREFVRPVLEATILPLITLYPLGTWFLGRLISGEMRRTRSDQLIQESEVKYRTLFEESIDTAFITASDGTILDVNQAGLDLLGYTRREIAGLNALDIYANPEERKRYQQDIERWGHVRNFELSLKTKDGTILDCLISSSVMRSPQGEIIGYHGYIRDLSDWNVARKELQNLTENLERHTRELIALSEVGQMLTSSLDLSEVYTVMHEQVAQRLLNSPSFIIAMYSHKTDLITCDFAIVDGEEVDPDKFPAYPLGDGPISQTIRTATPRILDISSAPPELQARHRGTFVGSVPTQPQSSLYVPLISAERVIGVMNVQHYDKDAYRDTDLTLLSILGNQAAIAIENARLYAQAQQEIIERKRTELSEAEQRTLAEALTDIATALNSTLDLSEVLDRIMENVGKVVPHDTINIMLSNDDHTVLHTARTSGHQSSEHIAKVRSLQFEIEKYTTFTHMATTGEGIIVNDTDTDSRWVKIENTNLSRSYLGVPIMVEGDMFGCLNLGAFNPGAFSRADVVRLTALADYAAIAIHNAHLYGESQQQNQQLRVLYDITRTATTTTDLQLLLNSIATSAAQIIEADICIISLLDTQEQSVKMAAASGIALEKLQPYMDIEFNDTTVTQRTLEDRRSMAFSDSSELPAFTRQMVKELGIKSVLTLPLIADGKGFGMMSFSFRNTHTFTASEIRRSEQAAELVALAIAKAEAHADLEIRVRERTKELKDANDRLQILYNLKDKFVSNVSHELRTPIASLKLYHHLLGLREENHERYLDRLKRETDRLEAIVEDMLILSRLDQDETPIVWQQVNINQMVEEYVDDRVLLASEHKLQLSHSITHDMPLIEGDRKLLEQALGTLLTNALNYTPEGGKVTVSTHRCYEFFSGCSETHCVGISVTDTGPGIAVEEQDELFQRFFRGKTGQKSGKPGTGLGLSIAHEIVGRHHGSVEVRSPLTDGKGSQFIIRLPVSRDVFCTRLVMLNEQQDSDSTHKHE